MTEKHCIKGQPKIPVFKTIYNTRGLNAVEMTAIFHSQHAVVSARKIE